MSGPEDGGPAFPELERVESWKHREAHEEPEVFFVQRGGMSLRDWFAGQALVGMLADPHAPRGVGPEEYAAAVYAMADAMLAARRAKP